MMGRIALAVWLALTATAQSADERPTFETASITPNNSRENGVYFNYFRGRFHATHVTLRILIRSAYGLQDGEIVGGPEWMNTDHFNIEAKGEVGNSPAPLVAHAGDASRLQLMMQALLADRFKLVVHKEGREANVYVLTLVSADGGLGPNLRRSDVDCLKLAAEARTAGSRGPRAPSNRCDLSRDGGSLTIGGRPLAQLTSSLSNIIGRTVLDQTGLTGNFDVHLTWTLDQTAPPPSLLTSIREQLGLQLVPQTRSAQILVVDRAERPVDR